MSETLSTETREQLIAPWMSEEEKKIVVHVEEIRNQIAEYRGMLPPKMNVESLGYMTTFYSRMFEKSGKNKAMRDEYFANLLLADPEMPIGRAKAIAAGSEFGQKRSHYEAIAEGYLEIVNTLKKTQAYWENVIKDKF